MHNAETPPSASARQVPRVRSPRPCPPPAPRVRLPRTAHPPPAPHRASEHLSPGVPLPARISPRASPSPSIPLPLSPARARAACPRRASEHLRASRGEGHAARGPRGERAARRAGATPCERPERGTRGGIRSGGDAGGRHDGINKCILLMLNNRIDVS
jgi:hypothetical protein